MILFKNLKITCDPYLELSRPPLPPNTARQENSERTSSVDVPLVIIQNQHVNEHHEAGTLSSLTSHRACVYACVFPQQHVCELLPHINGISILPVSPSGVENHEVCVQDGTWEIYPRVVFVRKNVTKWKMTFQISCLNKMNSIINQSDELLINSIKSPRSYPIRAAVAEHCAYLKGKLNWRG